MGSGPGGATLAWELSKSGKKVIVVEAGPVVRPKSMFPEMGKTMATYFWDGGTRTSMGNVIMPTIQVRCLGGGSVFNSAICLRATPTALEKWAEEWKLEGLLADDLAPHYDAVEDFMGVRPVEAAVQGRRNELFKEGCEALGWTPNAISRNEQGCVGSGNCLKGCRDEAKLSCDRRGIPEAIANGATVYTSVKADQLIIRDGRVAGITGHVVSPTEQKEHTVRITAACTILAAGPIHNPVIARRSGLTRAAIGSNLGFHPSGFHMGVFSEQVSPWNGATQGYQCLDFLDSEGIKLEALWGSPALMAQYDHIATWATWVSGEDSTGTVRALPGGRPNIRYDLGHGDMRRLQEANAKLAELYFAAGANQVITGLSGIPPVLESMDDVATLRQARLEPRDFPTGPNHVFGTMPMGGDPEQAVTDFWGKVYDAENLYVCDTSLLPMSPGANPMLRAMALAHRLGQELPKRY